MNIPFVYFGISDQKNDTAHAWMLGNLYRVQEKNFGLDGDNVDHYYTDPDNRYSVVGSNPKT